MGRAVPRRLSRRQGGGRLLAGAFAAAVLVLALVLASAGLIADRLRHDEPAAALAGPPAARDQPASTVAPSTTAPVLDQGPLIPPARLYAPLPGYRLADLGVGLSPFPIVAELKAILREQSGRNVMRDNSLVAQVLVYQFSSQFVTTGGAADDFRLGVTVFASETERITVGGQQAVFYRVDSGVSGVVGTKATVAVVVQGPPGSSRPELTQLFGVMLGRLP